MVAMAGAAGVPILVAQMVTPGLAFTEGLRLVVILAAAELQATQTRGPGHHQLAKIGVVVVVVVQAYLMLVVQVQTTLLPQEAAAHREVGPVEREEVQTLRLPVFPAQ